MFRNHLKIAALVDTALKMGSKCGAGKRQTAVYTPLFTPGIPALRPAGQLKLFKIAPGDFVAHFCLVSSALA